jgi:murein DD-endopeptidase MepM/ murein hydrolase activator NlpD
MGDSGTAQRVHLHFEVRLQTTYSVWSECNTVGFDPAVHPLRYLEYVQNGRVRARLRKHRK